MSDEALNEALAQVAEWTAQANAYELRWHRAQDKNRELSQRVWDLQKRIDADAAVIKQLEQHASALAPQLEERQKLLDEALATVERLKAPDLARLVVERVARDTASILHTRHDLGIDDYHEPISEEEFCNEAVDLATGEECGCADPQEAIDNSLVAAVEKLITARANQPASGAEEPKERECS